MLVYVYFLIDKNTYMLTNDLSFFLVQVVEEEDFFIQDFLIVFGEYL